jgi:hypothetical protein
LWGLYCRLCKHPLHHYITKQHRRQLGEADKRADRARGRGQHHEGVDVPPSVVW